jgi:hypothetical protein
MWICFVWVIICIKTQNPETSFNPNPNPDPNPNPNPNPNLNPNPNPNPISPSRQEVVWDQRQLLTFEVGTMPSPTFYPQGESEGILF